jgi:NitT/TauT family transport system substrate-binding protein
MKRGAFISGGVALAAIGRAGAQTLMPLRLGLIPSDMSGQAFFARDIGLFVKAGFDVELAPTNNGPAIAAAVVSGALDIGYSNPVSLVIAHDKGLPFTILAAANMYRSDAPTTGELLVLKNSPIQSAKDLTGKTIAVGGLNVITHIAARAWIDANGGDSSTVHFIEIPLPAMPAALQAGRVDAATFNPGIDPTMGKPADPFRILANAFNAYSAYFAAGTWFTSKSWLAAHPSEAARFVRVMRDAAQWAAAHAHESAQILANNLKENLGAVESATRVDYGGAVTPAMIQPVIDLCAKYNVIKARFPAADLISGCCSDG